MKRFAVSASLMFALSGTAFNAAAQSTLGVAPNMLIPVVAQTGTYTSEVFLSNLTNSLMRVSVIYAGGIGTVAPGLRSCGLVEVPPATAAGPGSASFNLGTQCQFAPGLNFGMVLLYNETGGSNEGFLAYSRVENFSAIGFSIEAFPIVSLSAQSQRVIGLKRATSGSPIPFQTNCFVGSFEKPVNYRIRLVNSAGTQLGVVDGSLQPFELIRYLDIFAAAGVSGNHSNVSAVILNRDSLNPGNTNFPAYVSFCTVQDNISFGADFRIGKSVDAFDQSYAKQTPACVPPACSSYDYAITDVTKKDVFAMLVRPPDDVICELKSSRLGDLEIQLRQPDSVQAPLTAYAPGSAAITRTPGPVVAGGNNQTSFIYPTRFDVVRATDGAALRDMWSLEVSARERSPAPAAPIPYSISCRNSNGTIFARPYQATDDF
jgi:hypothetical protein